MRLLRDLIDDRTLRSVGIWSSVAKLPEYRATKVVMAFVGGAGEPDTDSLFARLAHEGRTLVLPSIEDDRIVPRTIGSGLVPGRFGIPCPQGEPVPLERLGLVLVPGLAFTPAGCRLGQGGGHYDRFLATLPPSCPVVGVCFTEQVVDDLPCEAHDVTMHKVLTDSVES